MEEEIKDLVDTERHVLGQIVTSIMRDESKLLNIQRLNKSTYIIITRH